MIVLARILVGAFLCSALVSCASKPWWRETLDTWLGATSTEVFSVWGTPVEESVVGPGRLVIAYESATDYDERDVQSYELSTGTDYMRGQRETVPDFDCRTYFEFEDDIVVKVYAKGSGCDPKPRPL